MIFQTLSLSVSFHLQLHDQHSKQAVGSPTQVVNIYISPIEIVAMVLVIPLFSSDNTTDWRTLVLHVSLTPSLLQHTLTYTYIHPNPGGLSQQSSSVSETLLLAPIEKPQYKKLCKLRTGLCNHIHDRGINIHWGWRREPTCKVAAIISLVSRLHPAFRRYCK